MIQLKDLHNGIQTHTIPFVILVLLIGISLFVLQESGHVTPNSSFGSGDIVDITIGTIGLILMLYGLPLLLVDARKSSFSGGSKWAGNLLLVPPVYLLGTIMQIGFGYAIWITVPITHTLVLILAFLQILELRNHSHKRYLWALLVLVSILLFLSYLTITNQIPYDKRIIRTALRGGLNP